MPSIRTTHEEAVCQSFLFLYNKISNTQLSLLRFGNPQKKEPDFICTENVAVEITGIYDNEYQAEKIWSSPRNKVLRKKRDFLLLTLENLNDGICKKLNKLEKGNYNGFSGHIILVCVLQSPLLRDEEIEKYIKEEYIPFRIDGHFDKYFSGIFVYWKSDKNEGYLIRKLE